MTDFGVKLKLSYQPGVLLQHFLQSRAGLQLKDSFAIIKKQLTRSIANMLRKERKDGSHEMLN